MRGAGARIQSLLEPMACCLGAGGIKSLEDRKPDTALFLMRRKKTLSELFKSANALELLPCSTGQQSDKKDTTRDEPNCTP